MSERKRPGWITFAGVMMFLIALFNLVSAISALTNASWLSEFSLDIGDNLWLVGIIDLILVVGCGFAGYSILKGGKFGYYWAIVFGLINGTRWFFQIFWQPIMALVVVTIDVLILYSVAKYPEWFGFKYLGGTSKPQQYEEPKG